MRARRWRAGVAAALVAALPGSTALATADGSGFQPVLADKFADPSVLAYPGGYVAVATGASIRRATAPTISGPWTLTAPALPLTPPWATTRSHWAPELELIAGRYVLYYAATVGGLGAGGRCIGVAVAASATDPFVPYGDRPLVCPKGADTRRAPDRVKRGRHMPRAGVIDPAFFRDTDGKQYLLYKTSGRPSSIRMVRLTRSGLGIPSKARSKPLLVSRGIVENPALAKHGRRYTLLASEKSYAGCSYRLSVRTSRKIWRWKLGDSHSILRKASSGLCGPGGADVLVEPRGTTMFLHGWVCGIEPSPCPNTFDAISRPSTPSYRPMYAVRAVWAAGLLLPDSFVDPAPPPPPHTPTPETP